jgi:hypothetical protein
MSAKSAKLPNIEGRLIWGVNDLDSRFRGMGFLHEVWPAAYTIDLTRLVTSAYLALHAEHLMLSHKRAAEAIEQGIKKNVQKLPRTQSRWP